MSIFQARLTRQMAVLVKSRRDAGMASISNRNALAGATSPCGGPFGPICSPFRRLDGVLYEFTA